MNIGKRIYYSKSNGNVILDTGERSGAVKTTTVEEDLATYPVLSGLDHSTIGFIQLDYGQCAQDFASCSGYKNNIETGTLEFW